MLMNQIPVDNDRGTAMKTSTWERRSRANGLVSTNVRPLQTRIPIPVASLDAISSGYCGPLCRFAEIAICRTIQNFAVAIKPRAMERTIPCLFISILKRQCRRDEDTPRPERLDIQRYRKIAIHPSDAAKWMLTALPDDTQFVDAAAK